MASSSLSQESLDPEDFSYNTRKNKIRVPVRSRGTIHKTGESFDKGGEPEVFDPEDAEQQGGGHDSPTRSRAKDKARRCNHHFKKSTSAKEKRKLREKRRSTGVVHLPSTESTGDSLEDEDGEHDRHVSPETKRNTSYNEVIDADNPQTPEEERSLKALATQRNKSPSDLDADLEDNQDYDSTVSQSETNLTLIGKSAASSYNTQQFTSQLKNLQESSKSDPKSAVLPPQASPLHQAGTTFTGTTFSPRRSDQDSTDNSPQRTAFIPYKHISTDLSRSAADRNIANRYTPLNGRNSPSMASSSALLSKNHELEIALEKEREENRRLQKLLEDRDAQLYALRKELELMNKPKE
ncbi:unnamed protein product [Owenia fusiformis]|uniref:Uncharacterized protein n=1 Tax=Owenia fusiformis TaxID=6347 RepID=A0A8J1TCL8_OWEFU|nr:unnamed protein product [Owenia fusiformis]